MAITSSAKKANRASARKHVFNLRRKDALSNTTKALTKALVAKDVKGAEKLLPAAYASIDKACKTGLIKSNTADRKKSRLAAAIKRDKGMLLPFSALSKDGRDGIWNEIGTVLDVNLHPEVKS